MEKVICLAPSFLEDWDCKMGACSYTCCAGNWNIAEDRETYQKYHAIADTDPMKLKIQRCIRRNEAKSASQYNWAHMTPKDGYCPFLSEEHLCELQSQYGGEYLCQVCRTFPRVDYLVDGDAYRGVYLSCEVVAELALRRTEGIDFAFFEVEKSSFHPNHNIRSEEPVYRDTFAKYHDLLLNFMIDLMQNREYRIWERLVLLGMFMQTLDESDAPVPEVMAEYEDMIASGDVRKYLDELPERPGIQLYMATAVSRFSFEKKYKLHEIYVDFCKDMLEGLGFREGMADAQLLESYRTVYEENYKPWIAGREYLWENFCTMAIFSSPYWLRTFKKGEAFRAFERLALYYAAARLFVVGMAGYHKDGMDEDAFVHAVMMAAREFDPEHSRYAREWAVEAFAKRHTDSMAWFALLLRD